MSRNLITYLASAVVGTVLGMATLAVTAENGGTEVACGRPDCGNDYRPDEPVIELVCSGPNCSPDYRPDEPVMELACNRPGCDGGLKLGKPVVRVV